MDRNSMFFGKSKKANLLDVPTISVSLIAVIITVIFVYLIATGFNNEIQASNDMTPLAKTAANNVHAKYPGWFDGAFFMFWLLLFLGSLISAWFIDSHPIFFFVSIILSIVILVSLVPVNNVLDAIMSDPGLAPSVANFPIILFFIDNFFKIAVIETIAIMISLYAKWRSEA